MPKPTTYLKKRLSGTGRNFCLVLLLILIAIGDTPDSLLTSERTDVRWLIFVRVLTNILILTVATFWNIYRLIPRLLLRSKYVAYISVLFSIVVFIVLTETGFEWAEIKIFQLPPGDYGFFADNNILFFDVLASFIGGVIILIATSLIVFLRHWRKSGERIHELEETGVRVELEKARTKIDSGALFDVLDKAASAAVSMPQEASRMLLKLSKSLRQQLYESEHRQVFPALTEKTSHVFREQDRLLDFLIEKKYRLVRNIMMVIAVCLIGGANLNPHNPFSFLEFAEVSGIFLALGYFNVYVLVPRILFKKKMITYFTAITLIGVVLLVLMIPPDLFENLFFSIFLISSTVQIGFVIAGTTTIVLFQHWARNERYIAQLEAATMRAELEQLQNQINPHFLFNMLNNILVLIRENPEEAAVILHKMSDMLKYQFNDNTKKEVLLNDEIRFLTDFLNLEKIRRDRFEFDISVEDNVESYYVPPLLFIPFVENAVKHGNDAAKMSYVHMNFKKVDHTLHFTCHNSKPLKPRKKNEFSGLGLINVRRRLKLLYDEHYSLDIQEDETTYTVQLTIKL